MGYRNNTVRRRSVLLTFVLLGTMLFASCASRQRPPANALRDPSSCRTVQPSPVERLEQTAPGQSATILEAADVYKDRARRVVVIEYRVGPADELLFLPEIGDVLGNFTIRSPSGDEVADGVPRGTAAERPATGLEYRIPHPEAGTWSMEWAYEPRSGYLGSRALPSQVRVVEVSAPLEQPTAILDVRGQGLDVTFDATASRDPDGEVVNVLLWSFGDGCNASGLEVEHTYDEPGTYLVAYEIQDDDGIVDFGFADVTVGSGPPTMASPSAAPVVSTP